MRSPRPVLLAVALAACGDAAGPDRGPWLQLSAGHSHTCAISTSHRAWCWGRNVYGALGDGTTEARSAPVAVLSSEPFAAVSAGLDYTCALSVSGGVSCWGANLNGQLGNRTAVNSLVPVVIATSGYRRVSAGESHTCGITIDGRTFCWGAALALEPDGTGKPDQLVPALESGPTFADVSAGFEIACAVTPAGVPYCWGNRAPGVLVTDSTHDSSNHPVAVPGGVALVSIDASWKTACGLTDAGAAYCWGFNGTGQVGNGTLVNALTPQPVLGGLTFASLSARGPAHACGVTTGGEGYCWGSNGLGALGTGDHASSAVPVPVSGGLRFAQIAAGFYHSCGITTGGDAYCWGYGGYGQLGTGQTADSNVPVRVIVGP